MLKSIKKKLFEWSHAKIKVSQSEGRCSGRIALSIERNPRDESDIYTWVLRDKLALNGLWKNLPLKRKTLFSSHRKSLATIFFVALFIFLMFATTRIESGYSNSSSIIHAFSSVSLTSRCSNDITAAQEASVLSSINKTAVLSVASITVKLYTDKFTPSFDMLYGIFDQLVNCVPVLDTIKLEYSLSNSSGVSQTLVISLDPSGSQVIEATEQAPVYFTLSANWDGYNYYDSTLMNKAAANWNEPSASEAWNNQCNLAHCDYSFWVGLTNQASGGNAISQTGTDSGLYCYGGTCNGHYYYYAWAQQFPRPSSQCFNINVGDQITAESYVFSHGSGALVDTYLKDNSNGLSCVSNGQWLFLPYYAQFIGERPANGCNTCFVHLPKFSQLSLTNGYYVNSQGSTISLGSSFYQDIVMQNGQYCQNIQNGAVQSGSLTETWLNSCGT